MDRPPSKFQRTLVRIREKVRRRQYIITQNARREMLEDDLSLYEVEDAIFAGRIVERQRDRKTGELKYRIQGRSSTDVAIEVIAKLGPTGKVVIITTYAV